MEKQKIFWVVLSVSVFVVIVLVVGVLLLRQQPTTAAVAPGAISALSDTGAQIYEYQRPAPAASAPAAPGAGAAAGAEAAQGGTQTMHFYIGEGAAPTQGSQAAPQGTAPPAAAGQPAAGQHAAGAQVAVTPPAAPAPVAQTPTPRAAARTAPAARAVEKKPATQRTIDYWIQTGSYRSQTKAEDLTTLLAGKGLASRVFSYVVKNQTWYRVRIGPYGNKGEAQKFLAIVKQVEGLDGSYISEVGATRTIN